MLPSGHIADDHEQAPVEEPMPLVPEKRSMWGIESPTAILAVLAIINFLNYVDRFVLSPLVPFLMAPPSAGGLGLSSKEAGLLQTAFMVVHSAASIPLGILADRWMRKRVIAIGVGVWSVATAMAAFAWNFSSLFVARASVGIGEATYAPAASAMLSERFSPSMRARALGIFQLGMVMGGAVGIVTGGLVAASWGWRAAFLVVGIPGLIFTLLVLLIREKKRAPVKKKRLTTDVRLSSSMSIEATTPGSVSALMWIMVSGTLITFFTGAVMFWAPQFIVRYHYAGDVSHLKAISTTFGGVATVAAILGTLVGSFMADRLERRRPGTGRMLTIAIGVFASAPAAVLGFMASDPTLLYIALGLGVFFNVWYVGPILAALHDVVSPLRRATYTGVYFLVIHLLGDAISPFLVGVVDDVTGSLRTGMILCAGVLAAGGIAALMAIGGTRRVAQLKNRASAG
jgi:MFS transporter, Spinster family, sphingosine-1-phosphate transporter